MIWEIRVLDGEGMPLELPLGESFAVVAGSETYRGLVSGCDPQGGVISVEFDDDDYHAIVKAQEAKRASPRFRNREV
jgi:hypothetical protein